MFQSNGIAATIKHWPGEGHDDRDQHLVTTTNPLTVEEWEATHGQLYRSAIAAGLMSIMSAHIAFPAFVRHVAPNAGADAFRPASVSRVLNETLLRSTLGFNGLIVSDATPMGDFGSFASRAKMLPEVIEHGCDLILFSVDAEADLALIKAAIADGRISPACHQAALGLHKGPVATAHCQRDSIGRIDDRATARAITARASTLVKDVQALLPLTLKKHRRILIVSGGIVSPIHPEPIAFDLPQLLRDQRFAVTLYTPGMPIKPQDFDVMLFLLGEETLLTRGRVFLDWAKLMGNFHGAMDRHWHDIPTAMISFGYLYMLYEAARMPCYINAYITMPSMQAAVVDCLLGRAAWNALLPIDDFCAQEDAKYQRGPRDMRVKIDLTKVTLL